MPLVTLIANLKAQLLLSSFGTELKLFDIASSHKHLALCCFGGTRFDDYLDVVNESWSRGINLGRLTESLFKNTLNGGEVILIFQSHKS